MIFKKCTDTLTLLLYMTSADKDLPRNHNVVISKKHANTGQSATCPQRDDAFIVIYREEEWFKVLVHETFHQFALDFAEFSSIWKSDMEQLFTNVQSKFNIYEAYAEFWAIIIHSCIVAYISSSYLKNCNAIIEAETNFSVFQMIKMLDHQDMTYSQLFIPKTNTRFFKEDTNIIAYHFIKTILLFHRKSFINWCLQHNDNSIVNFTKTNETIISFCKFIRDYYHTRNFQYSIQYFTAFHTTLKDQRGVIGNTQAKFVDELLTNCKLSVYELA